MSGRGGSITISHSRSVSVSGSRIVVAHATGQLKRVGIDGCNMCTTILFLVISVLALQTSAHSDFSDIPGDYCRSRQVPCCISRQDNCSVPILGTLCYCDQFCDRSDRNSSIDCCPDYRYVCLNESRPTRPPLPTIMPSCFYNGKNYNQGSSIRINCNDCQCQRVCTGPTLLCHMQMQCSQHRCLVDPELLTSINQDHAAGWKTANYSQFWGHTLEEGLTRRLGTRHSKRRAYTMRPINQVFDRERVNARVWYDLRAERPDMISPPQDQGWCAADWVISTVQVATDRLALVSKGEDHTFLSPQHLLSCNAKTQRGCDGGHLTRAWKFIQKFGLVAEACYPWVGRQTNCSISKVKDNKRTTARCANGNVYMPLHRTGPAYRVSKEPEAVMNEIMTSGPVQATMRVPQDFFSYRSGIYRCSGVSSRNRRGDSYHSVRIVGWGEEAQGADIVKYWIVANSWGTWWGENGYFRIMRGVNECDIESLVLASWINPIVPQRDPSMPMMDNGNMLSNRL